MTARRPLVLVSGAVRELPPGDSLPAGTHEHAIADIAALESELAGKQDALGFRITVAPTAPASPDVGDIWIW